MPNCCVALACAALFAMASCSNPAAPSPEAPVGQEFTMQVGTTLYIDRTSTAFSFQRVVSDTRCFIDVECIQAGEAVVAIGLGFETLSSGYAVSTLMRTTSTEPFVFGEYRISLVRLEPYPRSTVSISPSEYRATFLISR